MTGEAKKQGNFLQGLVRPETAADRWVPLIALALGIAVAAWHWDSIWLFLTVPAYVGLALAYQLVAKIAGWPRLRILTNLVDVICWFR